MHAIKRSHLRITKYQQSLVSRRRGDECKRNVKPMVSIRSIGDAIGIPSVALADVQMALDASSSLCKSLKARDWSL